MDTLLVLEDLFKKAFNVEISSFSDVFLSKILEGRITDTGAGSLNGYILILKENKEEMEILYDSLFNSYTNFFRSSLTFGLLEQVVIPKLAMYTERSDKSQLRVWSAGCSTGQEAYSIAFLLADFFGRSNPHVNWCIFATDISLSLVEEAEKGLYSCDQLDNVKIAHLNNYFQKHGNHYTVTDEIREKIFFSVYDLLDITNTSPPQSIFGDFHLIMCSNVLLYYENNIQLWLVEKFHKALHNKGILVLGDDESGILRNQNMFTPSLSPAAVFYKL